VQPSARHALDDLRVLVLGDNSEHLQRHLVLGIGLVVLPLDDDLLFCS
jgi:hypothetical protein